MTDRKKLEEIIEDADARIVALEATLRLVDTRMALLARSSSGTTLDAAIYMRKLIGCAVSPIKGDAPYQFDHAVKAMAERIIALEDALEKIAGGFVEGGATLAISGAWYEFVPRLQIIARDALALEKETHDAE